MTRRSCRDVAHGLSCSLLVLAATAPHAQEAPVERSGRVLEAPAGCQIRRDDQTRWQPLTVTAVIRANTWIRCRQAGRMRLELPGNGAMATVQFRSASFQYLVPVGRDGPAISTPLGREAQRAVAPRMAKLVAPLPGAARHRHRAGREPESCDEPIGSLRIERLPPDSAAALAQLGVASPDETLAAHVRQTGCFVVADSRGQQRSVGRPLSRAFNAAASRPPVRTADFALLPELNARRAVRSGDLPQGRHPDRRRTSTKVQLVDVRSGAVEASEERVLPGFVQRAIGTSGPPGDTVTESRRAAADAAVGAFLDTLDALVRQVRQVRKAPPRVRPDTAPTSRETGPSRSRVGPAGARLFQSTDDGAIVVGTLAAGEVVEVSGPPRGRYVKVVSTRGEGWMSVVLLESVRP